ncbi:hypothetical protein EDB81DRAFT_492646 [Dactylonectria macrodidyma]|uniref:Uncharacterized protein n=1 Tax=Dactylonectria macrodidyma TaxID=307937 RepID=A0A9P9ET00_9HYPO|nr:hypothetical protein EDB81DRAFT_492646 [Dactylonectria macrodidyma]
MDGPSMAITHALLAAPHPHCSPAPLSHTRRGQASCAVASLKTTPTCSFSSPFPSWAFFLFPRLFSRSWSSCDLCFHLILHAATETYSSRRVPYTVQPHHPGRHPVRRIACRDDRTSIAVLKSSFTRRTPESLSGYGPQCFPSNVQPPQRVASRQLLLRERETKSPARGGYPSLTLHWNYREPKRI